MGFGNSLTPRAWKSLSHNLTFALGLPWAFRSVLGLIHQCGIKVEAEHLWPTMKGKWAGAEPQEGTVVLKLAQGRMGKWEPQQAKDSRGEVEKDTQRGWKEWKERKQKGKKLAPDLRKAFHASGIDPSAQAMAHWCPFGSGILAAWMLGGQAACSFSWPYPPTSWPSFHLRKEVLLWPTGYVPLAGDTQVAKALQTQGDWFFMKWKVSWPSFSSWTQPPHENS